MKAVKMICNRNCSLRTTYGSVEFEKDVERLVAPQMVPAALAIGVIAVDSNEPVFAKEADDPEPLDPGSRMEAITFAIEDIFKRNDPDDFTTGSSPKTIAVAKLAGIGKVGAHEIKQVLTKRNEAKHKVSMAELTKGTTVKTETAVKKAKADPPDDEY
jgi:hypothetical protein